MGIVEVDLSLSRPRLCEGDCREMNRVRSRLFDICLEVGGVMMSAN